MERGCLTSGWGRPRYRAQIGNHISFARILADEEGSLTAVQEALGHKNLATTRVYVESIRVKPDRHSQVVAERLGIK